MKSIICGARECKAECVDLYSIVAQYVYTTVEKTEVLTRASLQTARP